MIKSRIKILTGIVKMGWTLAETVEVYLRYFS